VKGLSLTVPPRSVYGFLGPNGAGKSTTIRMILGLQRPDRGSIFLFDEQLGADRTRLLARTGSLVEAPSLYLHLTGRENLEVHRRLLDAPVRAISEALDTVGLSGAADRAVRGYSSGMKQRLGLAQALLGSPELLLLDEPTASLDLGHQLDVQLLLASLNRDRGVTMVLSTHDLNLAAALCRTLILIRGGRVIAQGPTEAVLTPAAVRALYGVDADIQRHPAAGHLTVTPLARVR